MTDFKPDRYVSFRGIDGDGNAERLIAMLRRYIDDPAHANQFWEKFKQKLSGCGPDQYRPQDDLLLVHSYMNNIRDFFEELEDEEALKLLKKVELESC